MNLTDFYEVASRMEWSFRTQVEVLFTCIKQLHGEEGLMLYLQEIENDPLDEELDGE